MPKLAATNCDKVNPIDEYRSAYVRLEMWLTLPFHEIMMYNSHDIMFVFLVNNLRVF